jgi:beta-aspartyl-peptidase (threonine type)
MAAQDPGETQKDGAGAQDGCLRAAEAGAAVLAKGGPALDAVEVAARMLEDDPRFNSGTGAVLNADGEVELDASLMDGEALRAGAVAVVKTVQNPITLARRVMDSSPHVLLVGEGADAFARSQGLPAIAPGSLVTEYQRARWLEQRGAKHGTIGVAAVDQRGQVAAGTSTGGTGGKLKGRVGDSPLIGAGTVADSRWGAASSTGLRRVHHSRGPGARGARGPASRADARRGHRRGRRRPGAHRRGRWGHRRAARWNGRLGLLFRVNGGSLGPP